MGCTVSSPGAAQQVRPSGPYVIVGPVGTVTGDTARVLLEEDDGDCEITPSTRDAPPTLDCGAQPPPSGTKEGVPPGPPEASGMLNCCNMLATACGCVGGMAPRQNSPKDSLTSTT